MSFSGEAMGAGEQAWRIESGWDVFDANGDKVGDASGVEGDYLIVSKGFLFKTDRYVPFSAISDVRDDRVYLSATKEELDSGEWEAPLETAGRERADWSDAAARAGDAGDSLEIPVVEEELRVDTREVERGSVHVHKDVVQEQRTVDVPLREEEVHVERHPANEPARGDVVADAFQEEDIEIPLRGEEAEVHKEAVVREYVDVDKTSRERERPVSGTVRREEVHVEGADDATMAEVDLDVEGPGRARPDQDVNPR